MLWLERPFSTLRIRRRIQLRLRGGGRRRRPRTLVPEPVEVKPVVRCDTRIMLKALSVTLHPCRDVFGTTIAIQADIASKMLEVYFVAISSSINAKEQNHSAMHHGSKQDRTSWESRWSAEELALRCLVAARNTDA